MKKFMTMACLALAVAFAAGPVQAKDKKTKEQNPTEMQVKDTVSYLIGFSSGSQLAGIPYEFDVESFMAGIKAAFNGETSGYEPAEAQRILGEWQKNIQEKMRREASEKAVENKVKGKQFLVENLKNPDVKETASGLQYKVVKEGTGAKPSATDKVLVHYTGTLIDGTVFDSSVQRGEPISFPLNGVIAGWTEGLQLMSEGSKYILYIPSDLAYGDGDSGPIPGGSTLIFEVELIEVIK